MESERKNRYIIGGMIIVVTIICAYFVIMYFIEEHNLNEAYNYLSNYDCDSAYAILERYKDNERFNKRANQKICKCIDEKFLDIKNGKVDDRFDDLLIKIRKRDSVYAYAQNKLDMAEAYETLNTADIKLNEGKISYELLYSTLEKYITHEPWGYDKDFVDKAKQKQEEIEDKAVKEAVEIGKKKIEQKDFEGARDYLEKFYKIGNSEIIDLHKQVLKELDKIKEEKQKQYEIEQAKKEAEEKARKKQEGVTIGMTKQDVLDSNWGEPKKINTSTYAWGTYEQWVYGNGNYLYFENGILTSIQN